MRTHCGVLFRLCTLGICRPCHAVVVGAAAEALLRDLSANRIARRPVNSTVHPAALHRTQLGFPGVHTRRHGAARSPGMHSQGSCVVWRRQAGTLIISGLCSAGTVWRWQQVMRQPPWHAFVLVVVVVLCVGVLAFHILHIHPPPRRHLDSVCIDGDTCFRRRLFQAFPSRYHPPPVRLWH